MTVGGRQWEGSARRRPPLPARPRRPGGVVLAPLLLVAGTIVTALALLAGWAQWQLLDTAAWGGTSERLLEREEIRERVAEYVVAEVRAASGPEFTAVAANRLERQVADELQSPRSERVWRWATIEAHRELVRLIEDDDATRGDVVTLDLRPLIRSVARELDVALGSVAGDAGQVTIIGGNQVRGAREGAGRLDRAADVLVIAAPLVLLLAVALASGWRMRALAGAGIALAVAGGIVLAVRALLGAHVVEVLAPAGSDRDAVEAAWSVGTAVLGYMAAAAIVVGVALALAAGIAARPREPYL